MTLGTIEGGLGGDVFADVLYLRRLTEMQAAAIGEVAEDGDIALVAEDDGRRIGLTIISG